MQGGGSLGAFACGVFKGLVKRNVRIDIAAGTSIGAINAAIIVGSKSDHPENDLEDFWLELAESTPTIIPDIFVMDYDKSVKTYVPKKISSASTNAAVFGVPKMFVPRWLKQEDIFKKESFLDPRSWTYLYDHWPLAKTIDKYIDYKKLNLAATQIKSEYNTLIQKYGAKIISVTRIIRSEIESPTILKNANFSSKAVKELIAQGEQKVIDEIGKKT